MPDLGITRSVAKTCGDKLKDSRVCLKNEFFVGSACRTDNFERYEDVGTIERELEYSFTDQEAGRGQYYIGISRFGVRQAVPVALGHFGY